MNIYVGNLNFDTTDDGLRTAFEAHGAVDKATVITNRDTGRSRGFGFVEMPSDEEGQTAIDKLNGTELDGRTLTVNKARPRGERRPSGGRNRGGGRGGYGGGGGGGGSYGGGGYGSDRGPRW